MNWFLYNTDLHHKRVKLIQICLMVSRLILVFSFKKFVLIFSNIFFQATLRPTIIMEDEYAKNFAKDIVVTFGKHAKFV